MLLLWLPPVTCPELGASDRRYHLTSAPPRFLLSLSSIPLGCPSGESRIFLLITFSGPFWPVFTSLLRVSSIMSESGLNVLSLLGLKSLRCQGNLDEMEKPIVSTEVYAPFYQQVELRWHPDQARYLQQIFSTFPYEQQVRTVRAPLGRITLNTTSVP